MLSFFYGLNVTLPTCADRYRRFTPNRQVCEALGLRKHCSERVRLLALAHGSL